MFNVDSPEVTALMDALTKNDKEVGSLKDMQPELHSHYAWHGKERTKFIAVDCGTSGALLVERTTGMVYSIKAYGQPNYSKPRGTVQYLTEFVNACTANGIDYRHGYWYALHSIKKLEGQLSEFDFTRHDARSAAAAKIIQQAKDNPYGV